MEESKRRWVCGDCATVFGWSLAEPGDDSKGTCEACDLVIGWWLRPDHHHHLDNVLSAQARVRKAMATRVTQATGAVLIHDSLAVKLLIAALRSGAIGSGEVLHTAKACVRAAEIVGAVWPARPTQTGGCDE